MMCSLIFVFALILTYILLYASLSLQKYILFLISDANPSSMKDLAAETLALVVDASRVINDISGTEEMLN